MNSTLPGEVHFSTSTATVSYTDIIVTTTTTSSTHHETSTAYTDITETVTDYSATNVATITETVTAPIAAIETLKNRNHKRRSCGKPSSTAPSSPPPVTATSTTALYPIASHCRNLRDYSSACSCINAVAGTTTVTNSASPTEVETITESIAIPSTSTSVVSVVITSTTVVPVTTTVTSTTTGVFQTTTTVTSTVTPVAPSQTSYLIAIDGPAEGKYLIADAGGLTYDTTGAGVSAATRYVISPGGGPISPAGKEHIKLYIPRDSRTSGRVTWLADSVAQRGGSSLVTCTLDAGLVSCTAPGKGFDRMYNCGLFFYMATPNWTEGGPGCRPIKFRMSN